MQFGKTIFFPALKKSITTSLWLLKMILPISLVVRLLGYFGALGYMAAYLDPLFVYLGLPGSTAIVFLTSIFLPLYAPLAIITSMSITLRELTILALMCQIAHNLPVESAIQGRTGATFRGMSLLRIVMGIIAALILNLLLPKEMGMPLFSQTDVVAINSIGELLITWLKTSLNIALLITAIVFSLNLLYNILNHYNHIEKLSRGLSPFLKIFGLPENTGFLLLIGYIVGLAYGGALMMDQIKEGQVTRTDANLLNHHLALSHSVIEDNLLFVALGVSIWWILAVRLSLAWVVVWVRRFILNMRRGKLSFSI